MRGDGREGRANVPLSTGGPQIIPLNPLQRSILLGQGITELFVENPCAVRVILSNRGTFKRYNTIMVPRIALPYTNNRTIAVL